MMTDGKIRKIAVSCNKDCGGGCPLLAAVEGGRVVKIENNPAGSPYMRGCAVGIKMKDVLYAPERLRKPLIRRGARGSGDFKEIEWPEALDIVADALSDLKDRFGNETILRLGGSGSCRGALHNTSSLTSRFLHLFGGCTQPAGDYSTWAAKFATRYILGVERSGIDPGTLQFSNLVILWGANIVDTRMGCETEARVREAKKRGARVIVIDPRRTNTVRKLGTQWIPIFPGTDAALMMGVLHTLITEDFIDREFLEKYGHGFPRLERLVLGQEDGAARDPRWAAERCGAPPDVIVRFAREYGGAHPAALIPGPSIQRTVGGEEAIRLAIVLQTATGNLGVRGGSSGGITWNALPAPRMGRMVAPPNPVQKTFPVYRWPDAMLEGVAGGWPSEIRAVYNVGGNFIVQGSDIQKNIRAFNKIDFAVCHDLFLTTTARFCDVVLPATTFLERNDILFTGGPYLTFSNQVSPPRFEARNDYDIFCELAERLGFLAEFSEGKGEEEWLRSFVADSEVPDYEEFRRTGLYMAEAQRRTGLTDFIADPEANPLNTPSGRVQIFSEAYGKLGGPPAPEYRTPPGDGRHPLKLVTPHPRFRIHSQNYNIKAFRQKGKQALWIHPADASARGVEDGDPVLISSPKGKIRIWARITPDVMPGVVSLTEGVWPEFDPDGVETAGSANALTSTTPTLPSQGARTHSVLVEVANVSKGGS
ncbi:MAG: molybdopterin-dependent oxidoreductase [Desulfobacterales bacterium]|nr:molybdopterin-dependent oxidoreductase [Desulfobacterales bacterium]